VTSRPGGRAGSESGAMEVVDTDFRMSTAESDDIERHRCSAGSYKKNMLHRYCEYRLNKTQQ